VTVDEWINNFVMTPQQMNHNNNEKQTLSAEGDGCFTAGIQQIWAKPFFDALLITKHPTIMKRDDHR